MDLVFPRSCAGCGAWDTSLCAACASDLAGSWTDASWRAPYLLHPRLSREGLAVPGDFEPAFPVFSLGEYRGRRRRAIIAWKNVVDRELTDAVSRIVEARALELAGMVSRAWTNWLVSDGERLRRTTQPRTGRTPWIMPGELNQPELLALPPALAEKLRPEPVGPFPG